jgi:hypothetical protein
LGKNIVAVPWGNYDSDISGGTGNSTVPPVCMIDFFAIADFHKNTLVPRYSGKMCCKILQKRGLHG